MTKLILLLIFTAYSYNLIQSAELVGSLAIAAYFIGQYIRQLSSKLADQLDSKGMLD